MRLQDKLAILSIKNVVTELKEMLTSSHVSISWLGQNMVSTGKCDGSVEVDLFALTYLRANAFRFDNEKTLQERLKCEELWPQIEQLYIDSNTALMQTLVFRYLTPNCCACRSDLNGVLDKKKRESLFDFTPEEFRKIWKSELPIAKENIGSLEKWRASKEMVQAAVTLEEYVFVE